MEKKGKKISEKQIKIIVVVAIVVIVAIILLWGMIPEKIYEVSEILENPESFDNRTINVTGIIAGWDFGSSNFTLLGSIDNNLSINVTHTGTFPEGFGTGETVVVTGIFDSEKVHIKSKSIQIGCPSKY